MKIKSLFLVRTTLLTYPTFYVEAPDILEATKTAKSVVDFFANDKVVATISTIETPIISLEAGDA